MSKVTTIIKRDIFQHYILIFQGHSHLDAKKLLCILASKLSLLILDGKKLAEESRHAWQLPNHYIQCRKDNQICTKDILYNKNPLYFSLLVIHNTTRSKNMVQLLYRLGLSVSYDLILQIEDQWATSLCKQFDEVGVVCPVSFWRKVYSLLGLLTTFITTKRQCQQVPPFTVHG